MHASGEKSRVRTTAREVRRAAAAETPGAAEAVAAFAALLPPAHIVGAYVPIRDEVDPGPLAARLVARGARLGLPLVAGEAMTFRAAGADLVPGPFGTRHPALGEPVVPDLVLVPLLAFTRAGHRLGYGKGFYDRWLAAHPHVAAIGLAYAAQELSDLPVEPHDVPLAGILTEREAIFCATFAGAA